MSQEFATLEHDVSRPIGVVLSGGGARGAFQVGVWEVLSTDPSGITRWPDVISGTSAGALNGALIAAGFTPKELLDFWIDLGQDPPVKANETFFRSLFSGLLELALREPLRRPSLRLRELKILFRSLQKHSLFRQSGVMALILEYIMTARFDSLSLLLERIKTSYLFDASMLRERLRRALGTNELRKTKVKLALNAVDIRTGQVVRIVNHPPNKSQQASKHYRYEPVLTLDMIVASAAIPLLFNPVQVGSQQLWDGGLLVNTPLAPAVSLGAKRIIPVLVTVRDHGQQILKHFGGAIESLADAFLENAYNIDRKLLLERNQLAEHVPSMNLETVELYRAIRPAPNQTFNAGSYLYFEKEAMMKMYEAGKEAARAWLARGPRLDRRDFEE